MAATWKILTVESDPEDYEDFQALVVETPEIIRGKYAAVEAAKALGLEINERTRKLQAGASSILQQGLREAVRNNPRIFFASLSGPRGTYYHFWK